MTIKKKIAAIAAAAMMAMSMTAISASASTQANFEVEYGHTSETWSVTNLVDGKDTAIDFKCTFFVSASDETVAAGTIDRRVMRYSSDCVYLNQTGDVGSITMKDGWYNITKGTVSATVTLRNAVSGSRATAYAK